MTLTLPDDIAIEQFSEAQLRLELACGLFAAGSVSRSVAARLAGIDRSAFDEALFARGIPSYNMEMLDQDISAIEARTAL